MSSIELLVAVAVLMTGLLAFSRSLLQSAELEETNEQSALAVAGARQALEQLTACDFADVYAAFNADAADDAGVQPTTIVVGSTFAVEGLPLPRNDADGMHGELFFPVVDNAGTLELREDLVDPELGMPRDLNLDGSIDGIDHSGDYAVLPVRVRVEWDAGNRTDSFEVLHLLGAR